MWGQVKGHVLMFNKNNIMKNVWNILTHPFIISLLFCVLIISGQSRAWLYIFLLFLGLPYLTFHSIIGLIGLLLVLLTMVITDRSFKYIVGFLGAISMAISIISFFIQSGGSYNYNTFRELVPLCLLIVYGVLLSSFIVMNLSRIYNERKPT